MAGSSGVGDGFPEIDKHFHHDWDNEVGVLKIRLGIWKEVYTDKHCQNRKLTSWVPDLVTCHQSIMVRNNSEVELLCSKAVAAWLDDVWRWNEDEMSWINSLVLQGKNVAIEQRDTVLSSKCMSEKKKEKQNQITWSTVPWATLSSAFDDRNRCLGPVYVERKFSCPTFQMWHVHSTSYRAHSLLLLLRPINLLRESCPTPPPGQKNILQDSVRLEGK